MQLKVSGYVVIWVVLQFTRNVLIFHSRKVLIWPWQRVKTHRELMLMFPEHVSDLPWQETRVMFKPRGKTFRRDLCSTFEPPGSLFGLLTFVRQVALMIRISELIESLCFASLLIKSIKCLFNVFTLTYMTYFNVLQSKFRRPLFIQRWCKTSNLYTPDLEVSVCFNCCLVKSW